jgi:hypothetical protein
VTIAKKGAPAVRLLVVVAPVQVAAVVVAALAA